jgi:acyl-CoA synthetase (AMP-forming)/AMP-acid ligase II
MNLVSLLFGLVDQDPSATVAIDAGESQPTPVTRAQLWQDVVSLRADLARCGVGRGDCVAVWLPNWSDALCWQFATASLGAHVIGVNTRYNLYEVAHILARTQPTVVAVAHAFHRLDLVDTLRQAIANAGSPPMSVAVIAGPHGELPSTIDHYDVGAGAWTPTSHFDGGKQLLAEGDDLAVAFSTSGSTGEPKLAAHTDSAVAAHALADAEAIGLADGDVMLCALPLSGVFGFNTAMAALAGGATCLLEPVFDADAVLDDMTYWGVTHVVGGDDLVGRLADAWRDRPRDLSGWRWLGIADFIGRSVDLAQWASAEFETMVSGVYGSSEVFALAIAWPDDEPAPRRWSGGGRLVSSAMEARVVDPATDQPVSAEEQGELQMRGPNVVDAYLGNPEAAKRSFTSDGWFRTGDLVSITGDGAVIYLCRMGDVLRLRGFLVDPAEIEQCLVDHPSVHVAKVVGIRGAGGSTDAVGFVVCDDSADEESLRAWCAQALARFKVPSAIYVLDQMPTISGTNGTKIHAETLRQWARQRYDEAQAT